MMNAVKKKKDVGIKALLQAKLLNKDKMDPWDLLADCQKVAGETKKFTYKEGLDLIANAYGSVDGDMKNFVKLMEENQWIEEALVTFKNGCLLY